jgi:hypothetical protein
MLVISRRIAYMTDTHATGTGIGTARAQPTACVDLGNQQIGGRLGSGM